MKLFPKRISRLVAAILAIGLTSQSALAQRASCDDMGDATAVTAPSHSQHSSDMDMSAPSNSSHRHTNTGSCAQNAICLNTIAIPAVAVITSSVSEHSSPIPFVVPSIEARSLRPDSPPPKI